jgi:hypothetical protein
MYADRRALLSLLVVAVVWLWLVLLLLRVNSALGKE